MMKIIVNIWYFLFQRTIFVQYPVEKWTLNLVHYHPKGNVSKWIDSNGGDHIISESELHQRFFKFFF